MTLVVTYNLSTVQPFRI